MDPVRLAIDVGPLYGHRTGVGVAVAELVAALGDHPGVELLPYLLSFRTAPEPPARRLPLPAAAAVRAWSRLDHPRRRPVARAAPRSSTAPTTSCRRAGWPALVSVYDCWFLANPSEASPDVRRAGEVLRRRVQRGATVHVSSHATAAAVRDLLGAGDVEVVHLGPLPVDEPPRARSRPVARRPRAAGPTCWPSARSSGARTSRRWRPRSPSPQLDDAALVIAGAPGDDSAGTRRRRRAASCRDPLHAWSVPVRSATTPRHGCCTTRRASPIPRSTRVSASRSSKLRASACPSWRHAPARSPRSPATAPSSSPVGDDDALAAALRTVLDDDGRRAELVAAGHRNVTRFSWSATADAARRRLPAVAGATMTSTSP